MFTLIIALPMIRHVIDFFKFYITASKKAVMLLMYRWRRFSIDAMQFILENKY